VVAASASRRCTRALGRVLDARDKCPTDGERAVDITGLTGAAAVAKVVGKTLVLDAVKVLNANGITSDQIPSKLEGLALGPDVMLNGTLELLRDKGRTMVRCRLPLERGAGR